MEISLKCSCLLKSSCFLILICFVQTATCWDLLFPGVSKSPHQLCRFVPLGRSSCGHWCFSCCLPGGEWRKGPNGNIGHGDDRERHRESGHIFYVLKWNVRANGLIQLFFEQVKTYNKRNGIWKGQIVCKSHHFSSFFELGARVQLCPMVQWKVLGHFQDCVR